MEDVGSRGVVDDDGILEISSNLGEILDVVSLMVVTTLAEETVVDHLVNVELVKERVAILERASQRMRIKSARAVLYLRDRRCENHHFIQFTHPLHEFIDTGALDDIDIVVITLDLDGYCEVGLV